MHGQVAGGERRGHRVHQERHVVGDHHDPGQLAVGGVVDLELQLSGQPLPGQLPVLPRGLYQLGVAEPDQLLVRREPPVPPDQPLVPQVVHAG